jgi:hypothetical protein
MAKLLCETGEVKLSCQLVERERERERKKPKFRIIKSFAFYEIC